MLLHVSVYNHHQGAYSLCFAKVKIIVHSAEWDCYWCVYSAECRVRLLLVCAPCTVQRNFTLHCALFSWIIKDLILSSCTVWLWKLFKFYISYPSIHSFISIQPWRPGLAGTRAQSCDQYGSGTLHPGQVLGDSLPLLSPAFRRSHFSRQVPPS